MIKQPPVGYVMMSYIDGFVHDCSTLQCTSNEDTAVLH